MRNPPIDIKLKRADGLLEITWSPDEVVCYKIRAVRCACSCAACVDEHTGERKLNVDAVPDDIGITDMQLVGNYAVQFTFTDGHETGIYSWDHLYGVDRVG